MGAPTPDKSTSQTTAELPDRDDFAENDEDLSSSVLSHETKRQTEESFPEYDQLDHYQRLRHGGCHHLRKLTYAAIADATKPDGFPRFTDNSLRRFRHCGSCCTINFSESANKYFLKADCCRNRWCPACAAAFRNTVSKNLINNIGDKHVRFLTVGLQHGNQPLNILLDRLKVCFRNFTRREEFKKNVHGYFCSFEVKRNKNTGNWHCHAHILYEGLWWDQKQISQEWFATTGDSMIVYIENVDGPNAIKYSAKYTSKPANLADVPADVRPYLISKLHGRRLFHLGGTWKSWKIRETEKLPDDLVPVTSFSSAIFEARRGDADSLALLRKVTNNPLFAVEAFSTAEEFSGDTS